jgi:hypothetical protein
MRIPHSDCKAEISFEIVMAPNLRLARLAVEKINLIKSASVFKATRIKLLSAAGVGGIVTV